MSNLSSHRILHGRNGVILFLAALCLYFSYYSFFGERSFSRLAALESRIAAVEVQLAEQSEAVNVLQSRVTAMRPGSIDKDLLEERVRYMLGYRSGNEWDIL